eukprot:g2000.t1
MMSDARPSKKAKTEDAEATIASLRRELAEARAQSAQPAAARTLGEMMRAPEPTYGTCVLSTSPKWVPALAGCKEHLDFIFIDTEHIPIDRAQLSWMAVGLPTLVRIPEPDPYQATCVLDGGASGVVAPYLETVEQVKALRGAVKLRPYKGARLQQKLDGAAGSEPTHEIEYCARVNHQNALVLNIESQPAIDNLDEILKVPGIDCLLIGPHDLSCNLGVPEQFDHPKFVEACRTIWRKARAAGVGAAIHQGKPPNTPGCTPADEISWLKNGCNVLVHGSDVSIFTTALKTQLTEIRAGVGDDRQRGRSAASGSGASQACM